MEAKISVAWVLSSSLSPIIKLLIDEGQGMPLGIVVRVGRKMKHLFLLKEIVVATRLVEVLLHPQFASWQREGC